MCASVVAGVNASPIFQPPEHVFNFMALSITVAEKGFLWNGETFRTLSAIAKVISGQSWNGWVFFGIKRPKSRNKNALKGALTHVEEVKNA